MIDLAKIALHARRYLRDTGGTRFSDWEINEAINDAVSILADVDMRVGGELFRRIGLVNVTRGEGEMPAGKIDVVRAYNDEGEELLKVQQSPPGRREYFVSGDRVMAEDGEITLVYHAVPERVEGFSSSSIDLDESHLLPLAKAASLIASGDMDGAVAFLASFVKGDYITTNRAGDRNES